MSTLCLCKDALDLVKEILDNLTAITNISNELNSHYRGWNELMIQSKNGLVISEIPLHTETFNSNFFRLVLD